MAQSKLEQIALTARKELTTKNDFNDSELSNNYSATHTKAMSDETTPVHGKGTGTAFDTANGGGSHDIYGAPGVIGSGRKGNLVKNQYNEDNSYTTPDTEGNIGQVTLY